MEAARPPDPRRTWRLEPLTPADTAAGDRPAFELPREVALFQVHWVEYHDDLPSARNMAYKDALVTSGPVLCNDIDMPPAPEGRVPACVPFADRAEARFVPSPKKPCGGLNVWSRCNDLKDARDRPPRLFWLRRIVERNEPPSPPAPLQRWVRDSAGRVDRAHGATCRSRRAR